MQLYNSTRDYGAVAMALHWVTVILVPLAWTLGLFGDDLPKGGGQTTGLFVHIPLDWLSLLCF